MDVRKKIEHKRLLTYIFRRPQVLKAQILHIPQVNVKSKTEPH